jgi:hypothetical protein
MSKLVLRRQSGSPIRYRKVLEIKAILREYKDFPQVEQMYFIFLERNIIDQGFTIYELVAAFFPQAIVNVNGRNEILTWGYRRTVLILAKLKTWLSNKSLLPYAQKDEKGQSIIFNNQQKSEAELKRRLKLDDQGIKDALEKIDEIMSLSVHERSEIDQQIKRMLIQRSLERKKKKGLLVLQQ